MLPNKRVKGNKKIEQDLIVKGDFRNIKDLDQKILDGNGLYCIRLVNGSKLLDRYQHILDKREFKYIYIGKAEDQSLKSRLEQELEHIKPGTFFRSIGCVLKYFPVKGHLT